MTTLQSKCEGAIVIVCSTMYWMNSENVGGGNILPIGSVSSATSSSLKKGKYRKIPVFKSFSRTVTCASEMTSTYMCYPQGNGLNTSQSRLSYLASVHVVL